jgi:tRNA threonylcarbamoyladenosine biosynthesis protein TsaE
MDQEYQCFTMEQLGDIASDILARDPNQRVFAFYGQMGAGKTTLIKALCDQLKVSDVVGSPTFSIVNQYMTQHGESVYHFDFYRMKKPEEAYDIGYEEYLYSGNFCFLEWPEIIEPLLPEDVKRIFIEDRDGIRYIKV